MQHLHPLPKYAKTVAVNVIQYELGPGPSPARRSPGEAGTLAADLDPTLQSCVFRFRSAAFHRTGGLRNPHSIGLPSPLGTRRSPLGTRPGNYEQLSAIISKYNLSRPRDGLFDSELPAAP